MRNKKFTFGSLMLLLLLGAFSCNRDYDESLDELVMGLYFGMERDAFFKHCWDLNQNGQTHHGTLDNNVMYVDSINFDPKVVVNFYPKFVDDKIAELPMRFNFKGWAPWNKNELSQDSLLVQVVDFFENKYGEFKPKKVSKGQTAYYKVIDPLVIRVFKDDDEMLVNADIKHKEFQKNEN